MSVAPVPRVLRGELASAAWALALLVSMFALKWYGVDNIPGRARNVVEVRDAFNALSLVRWLMLATIVLVLGSIALHFSQRSHGSVTDTSRAASVLAALTAAALVYRVLIALPSSNAIVDQKLGALIGLGCSLGLAVSTWRTRQRVRAAAQGPPVIVHRRPRAATPAGAATAAARAPVASPAPAAAPDAPPARPAAASEASGEDNLPA